MLREGRWLLSLSFPDCCDFFLPSLFQIAVTFWRAIGGDEDEIEGLFDNLDDMDPSDTWQLCCTGNGNSCNTNDMRVTWRPKLSYVDFVSEERVRDSISVIILYELELKRTKKCNHRYKTMNIERQLTTVSTVYVFFTFSDNNTEDR